MAKKFMVKVGRMPLHFCENRHVFDQINNEYRVRDSIKDEDIGFHATKEAANAKAEWMNQPDEAPSVFSPTSAPLTNLWPAL